jgi:scyllo-inositol 2-dehydrogenase (NADP+)
MKQVIQTGLVGFGLSGRVFHAPFIYKHPGFKLHTVVSSTKAALDFYPEVEIDPGFQHMIENPDIELVVIATPHSFHIEQALSALDAGKHVVIEKPVAMRSCDIDLIREAAEDAGKKVFPYHNRRWDGDFLTLKKLIQEGFLGEVKDYEARFDRFQPLITRAEWRYADEDSGGTLFDLGPHLIDQAIHLFGKPSAVACNLYFQRPSAKTNDSFDIRLYYHGLTVTLKAGVFVKEQGPHFQVHGTMGSFIKYGLDPQEQKLKDGVFPDVDNFGEEEAGNFGILNSIAGGTELRQHYPTKPGYYMGFYDNIYESIVDGKQAAIALDDVKLTLQIIEAALESHLEHRIIDMI